MTFRTQFLVALCFVTFLSASMLCKAESSDTITHSLVQAALKGDVAAVTLLTINGADVNSKDKDGVTPLIAAASQGHADIVRFLLDKHAQINDECMGGLSALTVAVWNGDEKTIKLLISAGANTANLFTELAICGNVAIIQHLKNHGANINGKDQEGKSPLYQAAEQGQAEAAAVLIREGANINAINTENEITAILAATNGCHEDVVKTLIDAGANVNIRKKNPSDTPLLAASWRGHENIVKLLVNAGADINATGSYRRTSLAWAAKKGHLGIAKILIDAGADIKAKGIDGLTPLAIAETEGNTEIVNLLNGKPVTPLQTNQLSDHSSLVNTAQSEQSLQTTDQPTVETSSSDSELFQSIRAGDEDGVAKAIENGDDVNARDHEAWTPIMRAASLGNANIVTLLLKNGADISLKSNQERGVLYAAAEKGHAGIVTLLLKAGAKVNESCYDNDTPLITASYYGHIEVVKLLLEAGANVNAEKTRDDNATALMAACARGHTEIVRLLLQANADFNVKNGRGETAICRAIVKGREDIVKILIDAGTDVNAKNTALMFACRYDNSDIVKILINAGANVNAKNNNGETPLILAAAHNASSAVIRMLIEAKADVNAKAKNGTTALMRACMAGYTDNINGFTDNIDLLLEAGADINAKDEKGETALLKAKNNNRNRVAEFLTEAIAQSEKEKQEDELFRAVGKGNTAIVKRLIAGKININAKKRNGMTPLYLASEKEHSQIVKLLLEAGANPNIPLNNTEKENPSQTPLFVAVRKGNIGIVKQLIKWGANANYEDKKNKDVSYYASNATIQRILKEHSKNGNKFGSYIRENNTRDIKKLIYNGLPVNWWYSQYYTLLMYAAENEKEDIVDYLLSKGALVNLKNARGDTALDCADSIRIAEKIKKAGGKKGEELP